MQRNDQTLLVTGASGLLGANFLATAADRGLALVAVCHEGELRMPGVQVLRGDLSVPGVAADMLKAARPRWVVHCAALTQVDACEQTPDAARRVNVEASRLLAEAARETGASLLYVSTDSVFDGARGNYRETDPVAPINVYAQSKLEGERAVARVMDPRRVLIARTNIFGWRAKGPLSLAEWILSQLEAGLSVPGFSDSVFSPLLVNDLSEVLLAMMDRELHGLYHVGSSDACSKYEFALRLADAFDLDKTLVQSVALSSQSLRAPRPLRTSLDSAKAAQALGRPLPDLNAGLERFRRLRNDGFVARLAEMKRG